MPSSASPGPKSAILRSLAGRNLLFDPGTQALYELDAFTASVWQSSQSGLDRDAIVDRLNSDGVAMADPYPAVGQALASLAQIGGSAPSPEEPRPPPGEHIATGVTLAGCRIQLILSRGLETLVLPFLDHLECDPGPIDFWIVAQGADEEVTILRSGGAPVTCALAELLPTLKALLVAAVLETGDYEIAFHAAGMVRDDALVLLVGSPGAGKSTLALALEQAGWRFAADDVVLLGEDGLARGLALPIAAKAGAWDLIERNWPRVVLGDEHCRPDGLAVRFIFPRNCASNDPRRVAAVVLLDRTAGEAGLAGIDPVTVLAALLAEADNRTHRLSPAGFNALVDVLGSARCCRLTYSEAAQGAQHLADVLA